MKKSVIAVAIAGLMSTVAVQAAPQDNTWYAGGKFGFAHYYNIDHGIDGASNLRHEDKKDVGGGGFVGYQFNSWLGLEAGYDYLGKYTYDVDELSVPAHVKHEIRGAQLGVKLDLPVTDALDLYTRLGAMSYWISADMSADGASDKVTGHDSGTAPLAALGLEYAMTRDWATRLEYQWVGGVGSLDNVGVETDAGLLSLGVSYRFGQQAPAAPVAPAQAPAPAPKPVKVTKEFDLSSDVLFDFGKSSLKPAGKTALDDLYGKIQAETPKDGTAVVIGYTDRIGSDKSNQVLSEKRAKTVADYLIGKGIPAGKVTTEGRGEAESVTGTQCDSVKAKKKLIACLAPDRRVAIKVTGTKEVTE